MEWRDYEWTLEKPVHPGAYHCWVHVPALGDNVRLALMINGEPMIDFDPALIVAWMGPIYPPAPPNKDMRPFLERWNDA